MRRGNPSDRCIVLHQPDGTYVALPCVAALACSECVQDKSGRIRQGSPEEERALGLHITALAPTPKHLTEASQLAELLTLLGIPLDMTGDTSLAALTCCLCLPRVCSAA